MTALATRPSEALASLNKIEQTLTKAPTYLPALAAKAAALEVNAEDNRSRVSYEELLKLYPDFTPAKKRLAFLLFNNTEDLAKAYAFATKAHEELPDDVDLSKILGIILYRQGDYTRASDILKECATKRSEDTELMYYFGMARYRLKDKLASKEALQRALALKLNDDLALEAHKALTELK